jgi:carbamoyl-phosphate synthase large subunit
MQAGGEKVNILITNIGRRGYLVDFIKNLKDFEGKVFVSDCDKTASGLYGNCDHSFLLSKPVEDENKYVKQLLNICELNNISLIIPVIDPEINILSKYKEQFSNKGVTVLVSDEKVLEVCYSKVKMNEFLDNYGFNIAKTFKDVESFIRANNQKEISYPVFIKPIFGSGSVDSIKVKNENELRAFFKEGMIIQEYLDGKEYGVDTFVDDSGVPVRVVVKQKISMRSGETDKAITVINDEIRNEVIKMAKVLKPFGSIDTDLIETQNGIYIIDINPRFGGGYPATHMAGVNFIELAIKLSQGKKIDPEFDNYIVGQLTMKDVGIKTINLCDERYKGLEL